jgi:hypothetical protein
VPSPPWGRGLGEGESGARSCPHPGPLPRAGEGEDAADLLLDRCSRWSLTRLRVAVLLFQQRCFERPYETKRYRAGDASRWVGIPVIRSNTTRPPRTASAEYPHNIQEIAQRRSSTLRHRLHPKRMKTAARLLSWAGEACGGMVPCNVRCTCATRCTALASAFSTDLAVTGLPLCCCVAGIPPACIVPLLF